MLPIVCHMRGCSPVHIRRLTDNVLLQRLWRAVCDGAMLLHHLAALSLGQLHRHPKVTHLQ